MKEIKRLKTFFEEHFILVQINIHFIIPVYFI